MENTCTFKSQIGLIAATVGSAVGLGNVWRFPAETQSNGGAAFLLLYIICVLLLGMPLMLAEFSLGRGTRGNAVEAFKILSPGTKWWLTGILGVLASYLILGFYMVVSGWTFEYLWQSITGDLYSSIVSDHESVNVMKTAFFTKMEEYIQSDWNPLIFTFIMIGINVLVLLGGVQNGIEKISTWLMPILFILLIGFCCVVLTFPNSGAGLEYFFKPDFSKITTNSIISALGQAFFSLSLGLGCLITYSSYFPKCTKLVSTSGIVAGLSTFVAVLMGMIIFPAVFSFGLYGEELRGSTLVFVTLPEVFSRMPGTRVWSILFFLLLTIASLTSTISMGEVAIKYVMDRYHKSRLCSTLLIFISLSVLTVFSSLSFGRLSDWKIRGMTFFDFLDNITANYMLPLGALLIAIFTGWIIPKGFFRREITPVGGRDIWLYPTIEFIIRWIAPVLIIIVLLSSL
ncbi:MAG: sodium-dependent transporter [Clostridium sp.]|nr:sodium-dependent transporter [Prevotella sp.]MCM1428833.1 sodium-dependent transporter [Clostridium sp.]MCM1475208.1 sodium-dependent transporter [Muribaculaceae bacterium]